MQSAVLESSEAVLDAVTQKDQAKGTAATSGPDEPETMSSPEDIKSPQRLKKAGLDDLKSPRSPNSEQKVNPESELSRNEPTL